MALTRIDHVGVAVADLAASVEFYQRTFGMRCVHVETNEEQDLREAMLTVGDGSTQIQLLAPLGPQSTIARFLTRAGPGIHHIAYRVDSVSAEAADLKAQGLRLVYEQPRRGTAGSLINFVHPKDAGGVLVEIVQRSDPEPGPVTTGPASARGGDQPGAGTVGTGGLL